MSFLVSASCAAFTAAALPALANEGRNLPPQALNRPVLIIEPSAGFPPRKVLATSAEEERDLSSDELAKITGRRADAICMQNGYGPAVSSQVSPSATTRVSSHTLALIDPTDPNKVEIISSARRAWCKREECTEVNNGGYCDGRFYEHGYVSSHFQHNCRSKHFEVCSEADYRSYNPAYFESVSCTVIASRSLPTYPSGPQCPSCPSAYPPAPRNPGVPIPSPCDVNNHPIQNGPTSEFDGIPAPTCNHSGVPAPRNAPPRDPNMPEQVYETSGEIISTSVFVGVTQTAIQYPVTSGIAQ